MAEGFLGRWSRRKQEARGGASRAGGAARRRPMPAPLPVTSRAATCSPRSRRRPSRATRRRAAAAHAGRHAALTLESDFRPLRRPRRRARGQERRLQEALRRSAFQRDGRAGHLHRRLLEARSPLPESVLRQMASAKFLKLFDEEPEPEDDARRMPMDRPTWHSRAIPGTFPASRLPMRNPPAKRPMTDHADLRLQPDDAARAEDARARHWLKRCPFIPRCAAARPARSSGPSSPATTWWSPAPRKSACSANWREQTPGARRRRSASSTSARPAAGAATRSSAMPKIAALLAAAAAARARAGRHRQLHEPGPAADHRPAGRGRAAPRRWSATRWTSPSSRKARARRRRAGAPLAR